MIIKCPNCNGALEFEASKGVLYCQFCGSFYRAEDVQMPAPQVPEEEERPKSQEPAQPVQPGQWKGYGEQEPEHKVNKLDYTAQGLQSEYYRVKNEPNTDFTQFNTYSALEDAAQDARENNASGDLKYTINQDIRELNKARYYEEQQKLHEQYQNRPKIDYTKPYSGTSRENMTPEQIAEEEKRAQREFDREQAKLDFDDPRTRQDAIYRQGMAAARAQVDKQLRTMQGRVGDMVRYTGSGARIISNINGVFLTTDTPIEDGIATIDNKIYTCTTCGAELALTGTETSSFCAYCGQPTIVYSRMEKSLMPDSIIPFLVNREKALELIQRRLNSGFLIPKKVRKFEPDRVRGIYIPYWLFDASYADSMVISSKVKSGKTTTTKYYRVNTHCDLFYYPVDASRALDDKISRKLEPYDYSGMRPFNIAYMSGFYSDRFDMSADTMMMTSMYRAQSQMYDIAKRKVPGSPIGITDSSPMFHVRKKYYTMLPAWFMTFKYEGLPYTVMVNGQNGKVVGAVPYDKKRLFMLIGGLSLALSVVLTPIIAILFPIMLEVKEGEKGIGLIVLGAVFFYIASFRNFKKYKANMELMREETINKYVGERQDV